MSFCRMLLVSAVITTVILAINGQTEEPNDLNGTTPSSPSGNEPPLPQVDSLEGGSTLTPLDQLLDGFAFPSFDFPGKLPLPGFLLKTLMKQVTIEKFVAQRMLQTGRGIKESLKIFLTKNGITPPSLPEPNE
ncbi:hypothetical protein PHET_00580 [Paragonimus heterotremus]|uniref:Uncharacterized protein n=1 Tax=Paragonimus heterotremus TaxID=100268 RepID=A0A8J4TJ51_9TREM|nr:hypothetical protein PHET_00580 [Paragonimus heterotremus]